MASQALSGAVRIVLYLFVLATSSLVLYEILKMRNDVDEEQPGGFCLLWGGMWKNDTALVPFSGSKSVCEFVLFSSVSQVILSVLMGIMAVIRIVTGRLQERSPFSYFELLLVSVAFIVALATSGMVTGGLYKTCSELLLGWTAGSGAYGDKPGSCSDAYFAWSGVANYPFYHDLSLAQIGSWISMTAWTMHAILTCYNCCSYRRGFLDEPSAHVMLAAAEGRSPSSYSKLATEGDL